MMFGLSDNHLSQIIACFSQCPQIQWVKIYGSRANGLYSSRSDIDIAYACAQDLSGVLLDRLEDLPMPYKFDITHYESIQNIALKAHIDSVGKKIYP